MNAQKIVSKLLEEGPESFRTAAPDAPAAPASKHDEIVGRFLAQYQNADRASVSNLKRAIDATYRRFIDERVSGFRHADTGKHYAPVSREEAEARWTTPKDGGLSVCEKFLRLMATDPTYSKKFGINLTR